MSPIRWIGTSREVVGQFPAKARRNIGYALYFAQMGDKHPSVKPLQGFGGASVLEVVEDCQGDAYRAVYTVRFAEVLYVLHAFKKKSTKGSKTPKPQIDLIKERLRRAEEDYYARKKQKI